MFLVDALAQSWKFSCPWKKNSEVDSGFKGHLNDKPMQKISDIMDNRLHKVCTSLGSGITNLS